MSKKEDSKLNKLKVVVTIFFMIAIIVFITSSTKILKNPIDTFMVEKGSISYEES